MTDITKTQIEETIEALRLDHSFANNSCPVPIILERLGEIHALALRGFETHSIQFQLTELTDEIRRRDEIIESNKTLAVDFLAALNRVKELEATMIDAIDYPEEAANEGDRILHNRKLAALGEPK